MFTYTYSDLIYITVVCLLHKNFQKYLCNTFYVYNFGHVDNDKNEDIKKIHTVLKNLRNVSI